MVQRTMLAPTPLQRGFDEGSPHNSRPKCEVVVDVSIACGKSDVASEAYLFKVRRTFRDFESFPVTV